MVPAHTKVYEISGPMFFAAADKILSIALEETDKNLVLRMRSVNAIDATAMHSLEELLEKCKKNGVCMILSHVNEQPLSVMEKAGFIQRTQSWYIIAKYLIKINPKNKRNMHSGLLP